MKHQKYAYISILIKLVLIGIFLFQIQTGSSQPLPGDTGSNATGDGPVGGGAPLNPAYGVYILALFSYLFNKYQHIIKGFFK